MNSCTTRAVHPDGVGACGRLGLNVSRRNLIITNAVKARSSKHVCCSKTIISRPQSSDKVAKLCMELEQHFAQQKNPKASGIMVFQIVRDQWEDNTFHTWERYESTEAFNQALTSSPVMSFMTNVQPHLEKPIGMALYEWKNGVIGSACIEAGPKGEGGLEDATGASGAAGGASMKQTSTVVDLTKNKHDEEQRSQDVMESLKKSISNIFGNMFAAGKK